MLHESQATCADWVEQITMEDIMDYIVIGEAWQTDNVELRSGASLIDSTAPPVWMFVNGQVLLHQQQFLFV